MLLALGLPATVVARWHRAPHEPSAAVVPPALGGVS